MEHVFKHSVNTFGPAISLRCAAVNISDRVLCNQEKTVPECCDKPGVTVGHDRFQEAMVTEDDVEIQYCTIFRRNIHAHRGWMHHLAKPIDKDKDARATTGVSRKIEDKLQADGAPGTTSNWKGTQWRVRRP